MTKVPPLRSIRIKRGASCQKNTSILSQIISPRYSQSTMVWLIFGQKSCFLGPTLTELTQLTSPDYITLGSVINGSTTLLIILKENFHPTFWFLFNKSKFPPFPLTYLFVTAVNEEGDDTFPFIQASPFIRDLRYNLQTLTT